MAYNGNSSKIVSSSFLYSTLQSFYTKIKGLLDNKADKTALNSINPNTISGGYTKNSFYINTHPENSGAIIPFVNNDIAFLLKRGGSAKIYYDGVEKSLDISNVFDGSPSYWAIDPTGVTKIVIELTLHKTFTWTNTVYVDFGSAGWRAKSVAIDVINTNNSETEWTNKSTITNNSIGEHKITFSHNDGKGFNKVRFTFSDWATSTIFRIACLGIVNYGSSGLRETFVPKDGGSVYGAITPYSNNSIDLGSSSSKWKNVYATTFNGNLSGNASTSTTATKATTLDGLTSTIAELNYCDGVTSNIQTQLDAKASSSHTHSYVPLSGSTSITGTLRTIGELQSTSQNAIRMVSGGYGTMLRNDGSSTYLLLTKKDDPYGGWNDLRPFAINNSTGLVTFGNGLKGTLTGNASSATNADTVDGYHAHEIQTRTVEGGLYDGTNNAAYIQWDGSSYFWLRTPYNSTAVNHSATSDNAGCSYNLNSSGFGSGTLTYLQTSGDFYDNTGWCHYIIANHGDGSSYYNHTIALPFWDAPMYQRQAGSTGARSGWQKFYTTENLTYGTQSLTPGTSSLKSGHVYLQYE